MNFYSLVGSARFHSDSNECSWTEGTHHVTIVNGLFIGVDFQDSCQCPNSLRWGKNFFLFRRLECCYFHENFRRWSTYGVRRSLVCLLVIILRFLHPGRCRLFFWDTFQERCWHNVVYPGSRPRTPVDFFNSNSLTHLPKDDWLQGRVNLAPYFLELA